MSFYQKPNITRLDSGVWSCKYENADGSTTNLLASTHEELIEKLSVAHQSAVAALQRTRKQFETLKSKTYDQKMQEADRALVDAKQNAAVWQFLRTCPEFNPCAANRDILLQWISANGLDLTAESLQTAYDLNQDRLVKQVEPRQQSASVQAQPAPAPQPTAPPEPGLSRSDILASSANELRELMKIHGSAKINSILNGGR